LAPYKIALPVVPRYETAQLSAARATIDIRAVNDVIDVEAGTRKLTLRIYHPEVIWTGTVSLPLLHSAINL
jgi:hypothetical protein